MIRISGYEWELLEDGFFMGRTHAQWYQIFLEEGDYRNLDKISEFYTPPSESLFEGELDSSIDIPQILRVAQEWCQEWCQVLTFDAWKN